MKKASNYRVALPLLAVAVAAIAFALTAGKSSAQGRTLNGTFCAGLCIDLGYGDTHVASAPSHPVLTLDPGTYWLNMADTSGAHNFALRSCPGSDSVCGPPPAGTADTAQTLTPICNDPNAVNPAARCATSTEIDTTTKVLLKQGTYRIFCQAPAHEGLGMYVDITVVGEDSSD